MIKKIEKYETAIYIALFWLGVFFRSQLLQILGSSLLFLLGLRVYIKNKGIQSYLTFLLILAVTTSVIVKSFIKDFELKYVLLFFVLLVVVSFVIKTLLRTKIHYNKKYWSKKSISYAFAVIILVVFYYLAFGSFVPAFSGDNMYLEKDKFTLYYDDKVNQKDVVILSNCLCGFEYLFEREDTKFKIIDEMKHFNLELYYPRYLWDSETTVELFTLYKDSLNNIGLSKELNISLVAWTIFGMKEKKIN